MASTGAVNVSKKKRLSTSKTSKRRPLFTDNQIVHASDIQRSWRQACESRLDEEDFLVMHSGNKPRAAILEYEKFVLLWSLATAVIESQIVEEADRRLIAASGKTLTSLEELMAKSGITEQELESAPDVELIPE